MFKKTLALALSLVLSASLFTGCGGSASSAPGAQGGNPAAGGAARDDLVVILPDDFTTLDPFKLPSSAEISFCANIFDGLVEYGPDHQVVAALADSWEMNEAGDSYTFHLKKGVKFHNGEEMKANDVVYSVNRFISEEWMLFGSFMIKDAEAIDDYTVKINLKYPYGPFLSMLTYMYIANEKAMTEMGDDAAKHPIGTGAYKFKQWDVAQQIVLEANPDYYKGAPSINTLTFKIIPDSNTAFVALETGEADLSFNCSAMDFEQAKNNPNLATDSTTSNYFYTVNFNSEKVDKQVRKALSHAVDRDALNVLVNEGTGIVADLPLVEGQEGYTTDITTYPYDVELSKSMLKEAGYDESNPLTLDFFYGEGTENNKLGQALQSMFAEVGVNLELNPVETGAWWQLFGDGDYTVSRGGYPMEDQNTDSPYFDMYHKDGTFNVSRVNNPEVNSLLEQARQELDADKRSELYVQINQILTDEAYFIPCYFRASTIVYNANLKNVKAVNNQRYLYREFSW